MSRLYTKRLLRPCRTDDELHNWVRVHLRLDVPRVPVCPHHDAPFDYLRASYFEPGKDLVVWAPRGGGKTRLGAVATLLDLLHKPGVSVRILGGSVEQSLKMWEHLLPDLESWAAGLVAGRTRARRVTMRNGSMAAVLTQSERAVRGLRVQKLRCDEVELFDEGVWQAAQLVTRSMKMRRMGEGKPGGDTDKNVRATEKADKNVCPTEATAYPTIVAGTVEALSTLHAPYGLMSRVIESARAAGTRVVSWCILDVLQRCPAERDCGTCPLWDDCGGVAKTRCDGFVPVDDAIAMKARVSGDTWQSEMLCRRPSVRGCVFPAFDEGVHVREWVVDSGQWVVGHANAVGQSSATTNYPPSTTHYSLAIDFGFANPFVCLWVATRDDGVTHVLDEYVQPGQTVAEHLKHLVRRSWGEVPARGTVVSCDPAGGGRSEQTGRSSIDALRAAGYVVRARGSRIVDGLELIRAALAPAFGPPRLFVHPRCKRLIKALWSYHYPPGGGELPIKDGEYDHPIDALRYHFVNSTFNGGKADRRFY